MNKGADASYRNASAMDPPDPLGNLRNLVLIYTFRFVISCQVIFNCDKKTAMSGRGRR